MTTTTNHMIPTDDSGLPAYIKGIHRSVYLARFGRKANLRSVRSVRSVDVVQLEAA